jgi:hypothetical protein
MAYWVEGNKLYFNEGASDSYRIYYYLRPGKMVKVSECAKISTITSGSLSCVSVPTAWSTSDRFDLVRAKEGFDTLAQTLTATFVEAGSSKLIFTATDIPSELAVGDYISLADETCIPQIPVEWRSYLALLTAVQILESLGEFEAAKIAAQRLQRVEKNVLSMIQPRIERKSKAIIRAFD